MPRKRKKRRTRRAWVLPNSEQNLNSRDLQNSLGQQLVQAIRKDITVLETPYGPVKQCEESFIDGLKNKGVFLAISTIADRVEEEDHIAMLLEYEKLNRDFPEEPFIQVQIADCYKQLKEFKKYGERLLANFEKYDGYPLIDIEYASNLESLTIERYESVFGKAFYIHDAYPHIEAFDSYIITHFYTLKANHLIELKDYANARHCADIVEMLDPTMAQPLHAMVSFKTDPAFRRKSKITVAVFALFVLAILGGIIWGLIAFFRWLF